MRAKLIWVVITLSAMLAGAQQGAEKLPVRRVVLYKNGIGYFEHTGRVTGNQELKIDFTSSQLNDVLKSLTVLDLNGGRISGVGYNSVAPIAEQLKSLRLPLGESTTLTDFLNALRGARIQVHSGAAVVAGRLLSVQEKTTRKGPEGTVEETKSLEIAVVTDTGEVRTFPLTTALSVRVADHDLSEEISKYLNLVGSARDQDLRQMSIATSGAGERKVFVSYISEVPVWKSTYRILLPVKESGKPLLQGWAIVDNTVGEDWKDVELSLVAGAPQSFIQELSQPYYTRRPVVALPETAMLTPQTHEGTMAENIPPPPSPPPSSPGVVGGVVGGVPGGAAFGGPMSRAHALKSVNGALAADATAAAEPVSLTEAAEQQVAGASGQDLGDLFEYNLKDKVTILKNHSALVPIISSHIDAEKVTLWNRTSRRALRALWIKNTSGLTLDSGTFNIIENNAFAGEGLVDSLKPDEKRLLSYAVDQGVRVEHSDRSEYRPITRIRIVHGVLFQTREQRDHQTYTVRNANTEPREIIIEHPVRAGWKLVGDMKPEETSSSFYRFRVKVAPSQTGTLQVDEVQPIQSTIALSNMTDDQIKLLVSANVLKPETIQALEKIVQQKNAIAALDRQIQDRQTQIGSINQDQERLRENMKALKGSAEEKSLLQRYTKELNDQEDKLQAVRSEIASLQQQSAKAREQLDKMMQEMTLDETT
ncbi:MAG TPA: DUF4139 domain-containing protein [Verrucomicrobiae bacterium]|jgi:hypothetical protein|nr:DUF4139 domain-containing protein [Verrucomicrobiae bacterium]